MGYMAVGDEGGIDYGAPDNLVWPEEPLATLKKIGGDLSSHSEAGWSFRGASIPNLLVAQAVASGISWATFDARYLTSTTAIDLARRGLTSDFDLAQGVSNPALEIQAYLAAVSYTHLTLPTICSV